MNEWIYTPPKAQITVPPSTGPRYYIVAPRKFMLLYALSMGMLSIYWFYRNWRGIKAAEGSKIVPALRAFFAFLFVHSLLGNVDRYINAQPKDYAWHPRSLATLYVVSVLSSMLIGQVIAYIGITPQTLMLQTVLGIVLVIAMIAILYRAQIAINFASNDVNGESNANMTMANWLWALFGFGYWIGLTYLGYITLLPTTS